MRGMIHAVIGWSGRICGWTFFLAVAIYVLVNHQGMGVRGQIVRMLFPSERDDALAILIRRAGLHDLPDLVWEGDFAAYYWTPLTIWIPKPMHIALHAAESGLIDASRIFVFFRADGTPMGAPVSSKHRFPPDENAGGFLQEIVHGTDSTFLIMREYRKPPLAQMVRPNTFEAYYRIYRVNHGESPNVLTIMCPYDAQGGLSLQVEPERHDRTVLQLVPYGTAGQPVGSAIATFVWDSEHQRFIEPPPDPQGRWRVVE